MATALLGAVMFLLLSPGTVLAGKVMPPWQTPPQGGKNFTVPEVDNVPDLWGDVERPDLVVFFAGNQFMVVPELVEAFQKRYPQYERVYAETLPPGILADQIEQGGLVVGNLRITLKPDVFTAGKDKIESLQKEKGWFDQTREYARNRLAIMVRAGNPKGIKSLEDLGRPDVRVSMPNPNWEGIGKRILEAYGRAGGKELEDTIMKVKVEDGTTFLTHIHHRQTPIRIMKAESDAGPVWYTEPLFQQLVGNPIGMVEIPQEHNVEATYVAATMKGAPHPQAARDFLDFLGSPEGQAVYRKHGFLPPPG